MSFADKNFNTINDLEMSLVTDEAQIGCPALARQLVVRRSIYLYKPPLFEGSAIKLRSGMIC